MLLPQERCFSHLHFLRVLRGHPVLTELFKSGSCSKRRSQGHFLWGGFVFRVLPALTSRPPADSGRVLVISNYVYLTFRSSVVVLLA